MSIESSQKSRGGHRAQNFVELWSGKLHEYLFSKMIWGS